MPPITVAVDAMGGDRAPHAVVAGAVAAARARTTARIVLVGDDAIVRASLARHGAPPGNLTIRHASEVVEMCDAPGIAVRQKRDSSIAVGMRLVRDRAAHAFFSAGNSGAVMAAAMLILKAQPGIDRPAIVTILPTAGQPAVLLDAGATTDCKPMHLVQFARMGSAYCEAMLNRPHPRVSLLSIGEEASKGDEVTREAHQMLVDAPLNFVGNVEPKELLRGQVDVAVCDGFVGNLVLKSGEAFCELAMTLVRDSVNGSWLTRLGALLLRPAFRRVMKILDYAEYGGALLLGVNGVVVISHGRSNELAIANAIGVAVRAAEHHLGEALAAPDEGMVTNSTSC